MVNRISKLFAHLSTFLRILESLVFSGCCIVCGQQSCRNVDICQACEDELPWSGHQCQRCALPLLTGSIDDGVALCGQCLLSAPVFHHAQAVWLYDPPVAQLISAFKYQRRYSYGRVLSEMAAKRLDENYLCKPKPNYLIATPLHWWRHLKRGFNQSAYICEYLSNHLDIPIYHGVKRVKATPQQQSMDFQQRQKNVTGAFSVTCTDILSGCCVAIVDDVLTTGATANELSQCLLEAGVREIHIWCLARTPLE